jgi:hypothetical protein
MLRVRIGYIFLLFVVLGCTKTEDKIKEALERECNCKRVDMSESAGSDIRYITYHIAESKASDFVKETTRLFFHLINEVSGFCDMDKKVVFKFEDRNGHEQHSTVYHKCNILFEF